MKIEDKVTKLRAYEAVRIGRPEKKNLTWEKMSKLEILLEII